MKNISLIFFLIPFFLLFPDSAFSQQKTSAGTDKQVNIAGTCWDIATGVDLKVKISTTVNEKKLTLGESNDEGKFDFPIQVSTNNLTFEATGYRTITKSLHVSDQVRQGDRFTFGLKMIALDSQQVVRVPAMLPGAQKSQDGESPRANFEVRDAYLGKPLTAKICMTFPRTGRSYCLDTDSASAPSVSFVGELENIDIKVTSEGFDDYEGKLKTVASPSGEIFYRIKLLRSVNNLAVFTFYSPENLQVQYRIDESNYGYKKRPWTNLMLSHPTGTYKVVASLAGSGQILSEHSYTVQPGINLVPIRVKEPESNLDQITVTAPRNPVKATQTPPRNNATLPMGYKETPLRSFDNATLYFDQSSYVLRNHSKLTLDSISDFLNKQNNLKVLITGHTDNVGQRNLNVMLSEYRARVVAHYLKQKGVQSDRISLHWAGPDMPVAANENEDNKVKNRRVVVKVIMK